MIKKIIGIMMVGVLSLLQTEIISTTAIAVENSSTTSVTASHAKSISEDNLKAKYDATAHQLKIDIKDIRCTVDDCDMYQIKPNDQYTIKLPSGKGYKLRLLSNEGEIQDSNYDIGSYHYDSENNQLILKFNGKVNSVWIDTSLNIPAFMDSIVANDMTRYFNYGLGNKNIQKLTIQRPSYQVKTTANQMHFQSQTMIGNGDLKGIGDNARLSFTTGSNDVAFSDFNIEFGWMSDEGAFESVEQFTTDEWTNNELGSFQQGSGDWIVYLNSQNITKKYGPGTVTQHPSIRVTYDVKNKGTESIQAKTYYGNQLSHEESTFVIEPSKLEDSSSESSSSESTDSVDTVTTSSTSTTTSETNATEDTTDVSSTSTSSSTSSESSEEGLEDGLGENLHNKPQESTENQSDVEDDDNDSNDPHSLNGSVNSSILEKTEDEVESMNQNHDNEWKDEQDERSELSSPFNQPIDFVDTTQTPMFPDESSKDIQKSPQAVSRHTSSNSVGLEQKDHTEASTTSSSISHTPTDDEKEALLNQAEQREREALTRNPFLEGTPFASLLSTKQSDHQAQPSEDEIDRWLQGGMPTDATVPEVQSKSKNSSSKQDKNSQVKAWLNHLKSAALHATTDRNHNQLPQFKLPLTKENRREILTASAGLIGLTIFGMIEFATPGIFRRHHHLKKQLKKDKNKEG